MTAEEFSNEFDTLIGAYSTALPQQLSGGLLEFDEYEKSTFLTNAQEYLVLNYYSDATAGGSFETTEEIRRYLDNLVFTATPPATDGVPILRDSYLHTEFALPCNLWFIVYESVIYGGVDDCCVLRTVADVVPTTHDSYNKVMGNPFRGPSLKRVLRLDSGVNTVELVSVAPINTYKIRYVRKPNPIITAHLDGLSINGFTDVTECELHTGLHRKILEIAVQSAINSRLSGRKTDK